VAETFLALLAIVAFFWLIFLLITPFLALRHSRRLEEIQKQIREINASLADTSNEHRYTELRDEVHALRAELQVIRQRQTQTLPADTPVSEQFNKVEPVPDQAPPPQVSSIPRGAVQTSLRPLLSENLPRANAVPPPLPPLREDSAPSKPRTEPPPRAYAARPISAQAPAAKQHTLADLEETVGTSWLSRIGMAMVVIGVALFLGYTYQRFGPAGKIAIATAVSAVCIVAGLLLERRERYTLFGHVLIAGGWALAYFTAYAMRHISATQIIQSDVAGFAALLIVAVCMIGHSLKYRSEVLTAFAYALAYLALAISPISGSTLIASFLLAVSIVVLIAILRWYGIESLAIAGVYFSHLLWLIPIIRPMGAIKVPFPEYSFSSVLLSFYWLLFAVSHFLRRPEDTAKNRFLQIALILNTSSYVAVSSYQLVNPDRAFAFFLILGVVHFGMSGLASFWKNRNSFLTASTLGAILMIIAIPYKYSGNHLLLYWLILIEAFLVLGYRLKELQFRRLAWFGSLPLILYAIAHEVIPRFSTAGRIDTRGGTTMLIIGLAFLFNSLVLAARYTQQSRTDRGRESITLFLYSGWGLTLIAAWFLLGNYWLVIGWLALASVFALAGHLMKERSLLLQGQWTAMFGFLLFLIVNLNDSGMTFFGMSRRILIGSLATMLLYIYNELSRRDLLSDSNAHTERWINSGMAAMVLVLLVWYGFAPASVALGWGLVALVLIETGRATGRREFCQQGPLVAVMTFLRILFANLNIITADALPMRLITVLPLTGLFYFLYSGARKDQTAAKPDTTILQLPMLYSLFGLISLLAVLRFEMPSIWVAAAWAAISVALALSTRKWGLTEFSSQSLIVTLLTLARCGVENLRLVTLGPGFNARLWGAAAVITVFLAGFVWIRVRHFRQKSDTPSGLLNLLIDRPDHVYFFSAAGLAAALIGLEVSRGYWTAAWAIEGFVVFLIAVIAADRWYRLLGLVVLLFCTARIAFVDVWKLGTFQRIVAFLALGMILVAVSFLYTRYKDAWKRLLLGE
jgi:uncharacterized membrane protein